MNKIPLILQLDVGGNPQRWIDYQASCYYYAKDLVAWSMGKTDVDIHGGISNKTGKQSILKLNTIIAIKGKVNSRQFKHNTRVPLTNKSLFQRDQRTCAYCGDEFSTHKLTRDHIHPSSKGGPNVWTNVVTSCSPCNMRKDNKTLAQASMKLLYVPYIPNKNELLILQNRNILADQMEFLMKNVPKESRLLS